MVPQELMQVVQRHLAAENDHKMEETLLTLHPECVFEDVALNRIYRGREGAREYYDIWWKAFDLKVRGKRRHQSSEGILIAETSYVGVHIGDFYGIAPTHKPIELRLAVIIDFRDGLMNGERFYYDVLGLLRQMGVPADALKAAEVLA